jgi:hypothetical protein
LAGPDLFSRSGIYNPFFLGIAGRFGPFVDRDVSFFVGPVFLLSEFYKLEDDGARMAYVPFNYGPEFHGDHPFDKKKSISLFFTAFPCLILFAVSGF